MIKMTIENLLTWAFTQELWKVGSAGPGPGMPGSAWDMVQSFAELGTLIDRAPNDYGVLSGSLDDVVAHPDAVAIGEAVLGLDRFGGFDIAPGWHPFPEFEDPHGLIASEVEHVVEELRLKSDALQGRHVVNLAITCAVLNRGPFWEADCPAVELVGRHGKPLWFVQKKAVDLLGREYTFEADGFDRKRRRPVRGAYQKHRLAFPLRGAIISRLEWQVWRDALAHLYQALDGQLSSHGLLPFDASRTPWISERKFGLKLSA